MEEFFLVVVKLLWLLNKIRSDLTKKEGFLVDFVLEGVAREVWGLVSLAHLSRKLLVEDKRTEMEASEDGSSQEDLNLVRF